MKIKLTIPQIRARRVTHPRTDSDEIYLAYFVTFAKPGAELNQADIRKYVDKKISSVKRRVRNGRKWTPDNMNTIIETGDAETVYITFALYEYDDGKIYKKMVKQSDVLLNPDDFDWSTVEVPDDLTSWFAWVKSVWKLVIGLFNYLRQDDLLGQHSITLPMINNPNDRKWTGLRELKFKRYGGDYRLSISLEVLED